MGFTKACSAKPAKVGIEKKERKKKSRANIYLLMFETHVT